MIKHYGQILHFGVTAASTNIALLVLLALTHYKVQHFLTFTWTLYIGRNSLNTRYTETHWRPTGPDALQHILLHFTRVHLYSLVNAK